MECTVTEQEFSGVFTKYTLDYMGETIKYIDKNDGYHSYEVDSTMKIYVNPKDIMQF